MPRFVLSHRLAGKHKHDDVARSREQFGLAENLIRGFADVSSAVDSDSPRKRRTLIVDTRIDDLQPNVQRFGNDVIVEPEIFRQPAVAFSHKSMNAMFSAASMPTLSAGFRDKFQIKITSNGLAMSNASATVTFVDKNNNASPVPQIGNTNDQGEISFVYDSATKYAAVALIVPESGAWSWLAAMPASGTTIDIPGLPQQGPMGWWHSLAKMKSWSKKRGSGIRVGVIDSGLGPHPYLKNVTYAGSFIDGNFVAGEAATRDVGDHGTHVSGIIGAQVPDSSTEYGGIAAGVELVAARVFKNPTNASNADIANAIDQLAQNHQVDLINLSLGGVQPSQIERDALQVALECGTLPIAAAGNGNGQAVMYPASYPEAAAVSAIGMKNTAPAGSLAAASLPNNPDQVSGEVYLANFSNFGPQMTCAGGGVGIISTVPSKDGKSAPYAAMSGTSMACPVVCGSLASWLADDAGYNAMPRDVNRAMKAIQILNEHLTPLAMKVEYAGGGIATASP